MRDNGTPVVFGLAWQYKGSSRPGSGVRERGTLGRDPAYISTSVLRKDDIGGVYEVDKPSTR